MFDPKEVHWHKQITGMIVVTAANGFHMFCPEVKKKKKKKKKKSSIFLKCGFYLECYGIKGVSNKKKKYFFTFRLIHTIKANKSKIATGAQDNAPSFKGGRIPGKPGLAGGSRAGESHLPN